MNILLTPHKIGGVEIRNRIVMPPMTTRLADRDGFVTDEQIAYYVARAKGGVGFITCEMAAPERCGRHRFHELGIYDDGFLPGLARLVSAIHDGGAKASIQLGHAGGHTRHDICGEDPIAPSAIPHPVYEITDSVIVPQEMTRARIAETVAAFASAATRAKKAGFDCVEIHAAHGYLISQFHTPFENRRTDEYGGSLENRARFGLEVLRAVKRAASDMPVIYRLSVEDYFPGGMPFVEGRQIALWAADAGADALHIAAGHYRSLPSGAMQLPPMAWPDGLWLDYAAAIKKDVRVPVIAVGRLGDPDIARAAIEGRKCDFVALGRTSVAEPEWVAKVARGETPRRCLACNTCINEMRGGARIACVVNGMAGREHYFVARALARGLRIAVIGAGPAGLSYAALAAQGNSVTVFEREDAPGGSFRLAGLAPLFQEVEANAQAFTRTIASLAQACAEKGVTFRYGTDVLKAPELLAPFDRIVVAAGARYRFGLGPVAQLTLRSGFAQRKPFASLFVSPKFRDWFYYRARAATAERFRALGRPGQDVVAIGDARQPGKSKEAIASAFDAAIG
ncbi:MAG TPA: NAD(P)-binding protein [Stellaceae bacterium]|nr:NAD(P)-binding protein [Stellaceae bacterium]